MINEVFWLKNRNFGRLHVCLGRNDHILNQNRPKDFTVRLEHWQGQHFFTIRRKNFFLNVDWV